VHDKGFLHRDVKPSNVFLAKRPDGGADPKLIDFGIAKRVAISDDVRRRVNTMRGMGGPATALDMIVGTPLYMSPEQIEGSAVDGRSDVYALGITLYEMLAGAPPFADDDLATLLTKIVVEDPAPLARAAPEAGVPAALDRAVLSALSKAPADRPATAADFAAALWSALAAARHSPDPAIPPPPVRDRRLIVAVGVAALLALSVVALFLRSPPPRRRRRRRSPPRLSPPPPCPRRARRLRPRLRRPPAIRGAPAPRPGR